jgi:hypothetical protein
MPLLAKSNGESNITPIEGGTHPAVCYGVIDIGTQKTSYLGQEKHTRQVVILWEIPSERIQLEKNGQKIDLPRGISKTYTLSLNEKSTLHHHLTNWRGVPFTEQELKGFDLFTVCGANCLLNIVNDKNKEGKKIAYVSGVMKVLKGMPKHQPENAKIVYSVTENGLNIPQNLPDWLKAKIETSEELIAMRKAAVNPELAAIQEQYGVDEIDPELTDEIPF